MYASPYEELSTSSPPLSIDADPPLRLLIPKIKVNATIQHVSITKKGAMAVPTNYTDVGWYRLCTIPGHTGSAVIDGHVDNGFGIEKSVIDMSVVWISGMSINEEVTAAQR